MLSVLTTTTVIKLVDKQRGLKGADSFFHLWVAGESSLMRKAFGETGGVKVSQAVLSLSKMSKAIKKYTLFIYSTLHIFYMTRTNKENSLGRSFL